MYEYHAELRRVVDGDTLDLLLDLGLHVHVLARVRLARVDTPEVYGVRHDSEEYVDGLAASAFVQGWLAQRDGTLTVRTQKSGKYGRWIAEVADVNGESLNDALIAEGWTA